MLILIFFIALVIAIACFIGACNADCNVEEVLAVIGMISCIVILFDLLVFVLMVPGVATAGKIDEKIAMYEEENTRIEAQIAPVVEKYMEYEQDTFANLKTEESVITLATIYPELNSNELVQWQLQVYKNNNDKIRELKEEKINMQTKRWILFFKK